MAIASITAWLNSPDRSYHHGRALFEQYGDNRALLALLKSGSGSHHRSKLLQGMEALNLKSNLVPKAIVVKDYVPPAKPETGKKNPDFTNAPDQITAIRDEKSYRYAQARKLHETIRVMDSQEHRLQAALQLLDHMDFVNESWSIIDEWKENGKIREAKKAESEKNIEDMSLAELMKTANNLPSYISKDRQKLATEKIPAKKVKISARLEARIHQLEIIKKRLADAV